MHFAKPGNFFVWGHMGSWHLLTLWINRITCVQTGLIYSKNKDKSSYSVGMTLYQRLASFAYSDLPYGGSTATWGHLNKPSAVSENCVNAAYLGWCLWVRLLRPSRGLPPPPESRWVCAAVRRSSSGAPLPDLQTVHVPVTGTLTDTVKSARIYTRHFRYRPSK